MQAWRIVAKPRAERNVYLMVMQPTTRFDVPSLREQKAEAMEKVSAVDIRGREVVYADLYPMS